jgi:hypothetical protein
MILHVVPTMLVLVNAMYQMLTHGPKNSLAEQIGAACVGLVSRR